jgi:hypothetical protein
MTDDLFEEEISASELAWQLKAKYMYLASLYPRRSVEREVYQGVWWDLELELSVAGAAVVLQKRVNAAQRRIADERWRPEIRQRWQDDVACCKQILEAMNRFGGTNALLEHVQQQIKERLR